MDGLTINLTWEYFLSVMGSLIAIAYYANGRFTRLETDFQWLMDTLRDLTIRAENVSAKLFSAGSPISLTATGYRALRQSGLKSYIDRQKSDLVPRLRTDALADPYTVQETAFRLLAELRFDEGFTLHLKKFAFKNGMSTDLLRRAGAIYLRDLAAEPN